MKTIYDLNRDGYSIHSHIQLQRGRTSDWQGDTPELEDAYIPTNAGVLYNLEGKTVDRESANQATEAIKKGQAIFLTAEDFQNSPPVVSYRIERSNQLAHGGPGGYPFYPEKTVRTGSSNLDLLARQITQHPMATWAIRPQVGSWPEDPGPELYFLTPFADGGNLTAEQAMTMLDGRSLGQEGDGKEITVADNEVLIGSIKLDRKTYLIRFGAPQQ